MGSIKQVTAMMEPAAKVNRGALTLLGGILLIAAALRVSAAAGDLWVDEVWSLYNIGRARAAASPGNWLALFFHTNTHPLTTLSMILLGPEASAFSYRVLSVVSGIATVALAAVIGWRRSPREGLICAAMVCVSYPMVHYAGEARGYAPMLLAALAAFWVLEHHLQAPSPGKAWAFIAVSMLGLATHLTFIAVLAGLGVWASVILFQRSKTVVKALAKLTVLFGVQAIVITAYGAVAVSNLVHKVLFILTVSDSVTIMADLTFGIDPYARLPAVALGVALTGAIWWIRRQGDGSWVFFAFIVVYPLAFILFDPVDANEPRYFLTSALFALIIAARCLAGLMAATRWTRTAAAGLLALFVIGNGLMLEKFRQGGRGNYVGVLQTIAAAGIGDGEPARVSGYRELRVGEVLRYYARKQGLGDTISFVSIVEDERNPAPWFIDGGFSDGFTARRPDPVISRPDGKGGTAPYRLMAVFPHWGFSGDSLAVYRRDR